MSGDSLPLFPTLLIGRSLVIKVHLTEAHPVILHDLVKTATTAVALEDLMHGQPGMNILFWLPIENVLALV